GNQNKKQKPGQKANTNKPQTKQSRNAGNKSTVAATPKPEEPKSKVVFVPKNKVNARQKTESSSNKYWGKNR
ncbi:MAG TPA: hypothetical protein PKH58_08470, partial [Paludibacteraceae bacterium]|nr:hypothetical protein [Paludibacteraceae bacterium]